MDAVIVLHRPNVDLVVFFLRADKLNVNNAVLVIDPNYHSVPVAGDVEHHTIADWGCIAVLGLNFDSI
jgi:hypothetical protein